MSNARLVGMSAALATSTINLLGSVLPKPVVVRVRSEVENLAASAVPVAARRGRKTEAMAGGQRAVQENMPVTPRGMLGARRSRAAGAPYILARHCTFWSGRPSAGAIA